MEGPSRSAGMRKSRRSRSQRDRELRRRRRVNLAEERATSLSSGSDREGRGTNNVLGPGGRECRPVFGRHRPPRRRKRESVSCEEDIIDGFAIASFISLEALEMDCSLKPNQRTDMLGRQNKRKRGSEKNGGGPLSEPEDGAPYSFLFMIKVKSALRKCQVSYFRNIFEQVEIHCDISCRSEKRPLAFMTVHRLFLSAVDPSPSNLATAGKSCPPLSARCGGISRLMVTPRVSGLERSQETSLEPHFPEPFSSSTSPGLICMSSPVTASVAVPRPNPVNGNGTRHNGSPPLSKPKPYGLPPRSQSIYSRSASCRRHRKREGRRSVPGAENNSAAAGRNTPGGPSAPNSSSSSSGRTSQNVPPLAFQFHQHNHQHQHTHTHQHFTPFLHPSATAPPLVSRPLLLLRTSKPGKWCAMHVHVAWMILSHQRKVKLMQADPHKLDFRSDLLSRFSGAVGLGGALPPTHDLTRPPSLFPAADPYGRSPPFAPLGALGSGAFGGLGSPALAGSVFSPKEPPPSAVGGLPTSNHHIETWNRLHGGPPMFSGGPWIKEMDRRDERDRGKDMERRDIPHIKDEKDRDSMLYGRQPVRMSPVGPLFRPRSSTPVNHINGHSSAMGGSGGPIEDLTRSLNRDRERDRDGDKRPLPTMSSRAPPLGSSSLVADRDRPRSSSSSVLTTPPPSHRSIPSPLDLYPRSQAQAAHNLHNDHSQRDGSLPASSAASSSISSLSHVKKSDRTSTPVSKPSLSLPTVKVKEERKEEPEHIPITHPPPAPSHTFDRPNSHPHHPSSGTPSSCSLSLTPTPGVPLPPPTHNPPPHQPVMERSRPFEAILGSTAGLLVGSAGERFPHGPPPGQPQGPHSFTWDPWREIMAHQPHPHRREALALRSDPHLTLRHDPHLVRLLQHQRHMVEAERAAVVAAAAAAGPPHPPTSTSAAASSGVRPEFGLIPFDRPAQILREDFERARYFAMHPHLPHGSHLSSPSHAAAAAAAAAHLEQLHPGLLPHSLPSGASASQHHPSLYSRLGPINPHHMSNGILAKDLVGALSVGAPPPLIPSIASRSATPPRTSRLRGPSELALYSTHKDGESR
uniref:Fibrosin n=1 Tax=Xiphophorus couchianus TaxID=32473 RepID=A0A3B5L2K3_9TELE